MTVEVFKSTTRAGNVNHTAYFDDEMFDLATFFSSSINFSIIDSDSSLASRYKGDPITGAVWNTAADISKDNSWFIIQCETSYHASLPKWQCKIQCTQSVAFADISDPTGVAYPLHHGSTNVTCFRFAPMGGWGSENTTPDFNPTGVGVTGHTTENHVMYVGPNTSLGTGNEWRWILVTDTGGFCRFNRLSVDPFYFTSFGGYMGDYIPIDNTIQLYPRCFLSSGNTTNGCSPYTLGNGRMLCEDAYTSGNLWSTTDGSPGIALYNESDTLIEEEYTLPGHNLLFNEYTCPNNLGSVNTMDLAPYTPLVFSLGSIGTIPLIAKGRGIGSVLLDTGDWVSLSDSYCIFVKWDGSTSLFM